MAQGDHKTTKSGESGEEGGVFFVASEQPPMVTEPSNGALDDPALAIAAQGATVLSDGVRPLMAQAQPFSTSLKG